MPIRDKLLKSVISLTALYLAAIAIYPTASFASGGPILGEASKFQIVSGGAITLGGAITGLDNGNLSTSTPAVDDLRAALASLSAKPATAVAADLGGKTYLPGVYAAVGGAAFAMTSNVILDGNGDCDSKFFFITPAAMNTTAGVSITLINSAKPNNVYWVVGAAVTIAASSTLSGNFLSGAAMTVGASSIVDGRFLALGAITIGASVGFQGFPISGCAVPVGGLSISVPESQTARNLNPGEAVSIELGDATVIDTRGNGPSSSWSVSVLCSDFQDANGNVLSSENFSYRAEGFRVTGGINVGNHTPAHMNTASAMLTAGSGSGDNSLTWMPVITVSVPPEQVAGIYFGTITHSVI